MRRLWTHRWWGSPPAQRNCLRSRTPEVEWTPCQGPSDPAEPQTEEPRMLSGLEPQEIIRNWWNSSEKLCECQTVFFNVRVSFQRSAKYWFKDVFQCVTNTHNKRKHTILMWLARTTKLHDDENNKWNKKGIFEYCNLHFSLITNCFKA